MASDSENPTEAAADPQQEHKIIIKSQYKDIMVKVQGGTYYLDRLRLALKSDYFEKLFTEDFSERNSDLIELPLLDTDTFSLIVDFIYGDTLDSIIDADNFVSLLIAFDYLQMNIDADTYKNLITRNLCLRASLDDILGLYCFIVETATYEYLLPVIFDGLSEHLVKLQDRDEFLSIALDHLIEIISRREIRSDSVEKYQTRVFSKICAKWICHELENRLPRIIDLVNAIRYRFYFSNKISGDDPELRMPAIKEHTKQDDVSRYVYKLLLYSGKICKGVDASESEEYENRVYEYASGGGRYKCSTCGSESLKPDGEFNREPKLEKFLKSCHFYDITFKVDEKIYKLHRSVLESVSLYFKQMFSAEYSEIAAQCEGIPTPPSKDKVYIIDDIDPTIFDIVIDYMYFGKEEFTSDTILGLFKALNILKMERLRMLCRSWMEKNTSDICASDALEILHLIRNNSDYDSLSVYLSCTYIETSWPKIGKLPVLARFFDKMSLDQLAFEIHPDGYEVYLFDKIDQNTFKLIIDYVYYNEFESSMQVYDIRIMTVLKASDMLKMNELMGECVEWSMRWQSNAISSEDVNEILNIASRNIQYCDALNSVYLVKHLAEWPKINMKLFCTTPYDCLEDVLTSPMLFLDDPRDILDICSKWVVHDVENRYHLIPRVALAINQNRLVDCDNYSIASPSDSNACSQDFVKDKLWEILSSTSVLPVDVLSKNSTTVKKTTEHPVFITIEDNRQLKIFDSNWDEIESFYLCKNAGKYGSSELVSATMMDDNLFILNSRRNSRCIEIFFHVYNFSTNTLFALTSDPRIYKTEDDEIYGPRIKNTLLNCRGEIYCCLRDGLVLKYSFEFNRWMKFAEPEPDKDGIFFTSCGNQLYRMYKLSQNNDTIDYTLERYNFKKNSWIYKPSSKLSTTYDGEPHELIFVINYGFAVLFKERLFYFDQKKQYWQQTRLQPYLDYRPGYFESKVVTSRIGQNEAGELLYVVNNKLYRFCRWSEDWELKRTWPMRKKEGSYYTSTEVVPYENIVAIHKPTIL